MDGPNVGSDVLPNSAITSGQGSHQLPVFIMEADGYSIVLQLHDKLDRLTFQKLIETFSPFNDLIGMIRIRQ